MPIASAVQKGTYAYIYDEKGRLLCTISAGNGPKDGVVGYTSATVSIRKGSFVYIYNEKGHLQSTVCTERVIG